MSSPRKEAAQRLPRREDVYAFVFVIFSRDSRGHRPFYARRRRPFSARGRRPILLGVIDPFCSGSQTHSARPDKRGSVPLSSNV